MNRVCCPTCESSAAVPAGAGVVACPECGRSLGSGPIDNEAVGENRLIADLLEAFASADALLDANAPTWLDAREARVGWEGALCALRPGCRFADFEIRGELGRGGMGIVYRARQISLNREVALKVLPPALQRRGTVLRRFRREAQAVARLKHPNIVPVFFQGEEDGQLYYAMELVSGVCLHVAIHSRRDLLTRDFWRRRMQHAGAESEGFVDSPGAVTPASAHARCDAPIAAEDFKLIATMIAGAADGLAHAAAHGVIHRDIKPHNLLVGCDGLLRITDFGLALLEDEPHITMGGEVMGTAAYLAPEQLGGNPRTIDHRTDIYALGVTLYEVITGQRAFKGESRDQILTNIRTTEPVRPRRINPRIPRDLETICVKAMDKYPARRYATAADMAGDLRRFVEGQTITGRRVGALEAGLRRIRRRPTVAVAGVCAALAMLISGAWMLTAFGHQREDAARLLQDAYDRLVYIDYRMPDMVAESVDLAERLGADPVELNVTRALMELGRQESASAAIRLHDVVRRSPSDRRAMYLLAWAQWRTGDRATSQATFARADELGGPEGPDGWFFRGLASHFDRPAEAVESYRRANALRAGRHEFYPQAVLHLARARNQEMYIGRSLETFKEAASGLHQLIAHGHYGAYAYYLLSITYRLAAEIETFHAGGIDKDAAYHFAQALEWARAGQLVDPTDNRPVAAEAEYYEALGLLDEALDTRTRAIELAVRPHERWEGHHYRWRLNYWTGRLTEALADLDICRQYSPDSRSYAFVYPGLVLAELGDLEEARDLARSIFRHDSREAQAALWSASMLRLLGRLDEAQSLLESARDSVDFAGVTVAPQSGEWMIALYDFCAGEVVLDDLLAMAEGVEAARKLRAEVYFHAGVRALAEGDRTTAIDYLTAAQQCFDSEHAYTFHARTLLGKLQSDATWPPWLAASGAAGEETGLGVE